jgi:hypothetical protein
MDGMDLNEPITLDRELQFCEEGNSMALRFLAASRATVRNAHMESPGDLQAQLDASLAPFLAHVNSCPHCNQD